jgi:hypothetical protein
MTFSLPPASPKSPSSTEPLGEYWTAFYPIGAATGIAMRDR